MRSSAAPLIHSTVTSEWRFGVADPTTATSHHLQTKSTPKLRPTPPKISNTSAAPHPSARSAAAKQSRTDRLRDSSDAPLTQRDRKEIEVSLYEVGCLDEVERKLVKAVVDLEEIDPHLQTSPPIFRTMTKDSMSTDTISALAPSSSTFSMAARGAEPSKDNITLEAEPLQSHEFDAHGRIATDRSRSSSLEKPLSPEESHTEPSHEAPVRLFSSGSLSARETQKEKWQYLQSEPQDYVPPPDPGKLMEHYANRPSLRDISGFTAGLAKRPASFRVPRPTSPQRSTSTFHSARIATGKSVLPPLPLKIELKSHQRPPLKPCKAPHSPKRDASPLLPSNEDEMRERALVNQVLEVAREFDENADEQWIWDVQSNSEMSAKVEAGFRELGIKAIERVPSDVLDALLEIQKDVEPSEQHFSRRDHAETIARLKRSPRLPKDRSLSCPQSSPSAINYNRRYGSSWYIPPKNWDLVSKYGTTEEDRFVRFTNRLSMTLSLISRFQDFVLFSMLIVFGKVSM
eukprot:TRINITY_DN5630_c0_g2_i10.p1 TRINITY_DN5630_c0_g2~~TRINITY_DN5630_c0_g2_i10.p1  ORF type:complete len:516 (-),score=107.56 TRINITY_DN5630_c0_g2_i10:401-1948(-)